MEKTIKRINELAAKAKAEGLSPEEIAENRRKAREEKEKRKNAPADGDNSTDD